MFRCVLSLSAIIQAIVRFNIYFVNFGPQQNTHVSKNDNQNKPDSPFQIYPPRYGHLWPALVSSDHDLIGFKIATEGNRF